MFIMARVQIENLIWMMTMDVDCCDFQVILIFHTSSPFATDVRWPVRVPVVCKIVKVVISVFAFVQTSIYQLLLCRKPVVTHGASVGRAFSHVHLFYLSVCDRSNRKTA